MNRRRLPDCQRGAVSLSRTPDRLPPPRSTDLYACHFFLHIVGIIRGDTRSGIHQGMEGCHMPRMNLQVSSQPEPIAVGIIVRPRVEHGIRPFEGRRRQSPIGIQVVGGPMIPVVVIAEVHRPHMIRSVELAVKSNKEFTGTLLTFESIRLSKPDPGDLVEPRTVLRDERLAEVFLGM